MIGWRVGWVAGPEEIMADIGLAGLTNVVCQVGIAQQAVTAALNHPGSGADVAAATSIWQQRSTLVLDQLAGYPCVRPHGGWSLLIDTHSMGLLPGKHPGGCSPVPRSPPPRWMAGGPAAAGTCAWSSPANPPNGSPACAPASTPH